MPHTGHQDQSIARVLKAIQFLRDGKAVVLADEEDRENEGDLIFVAEKSTPELVNFLIRDGRGLICLALDPAIVDRLQLPIMVDHFKDKDSKNTAFTLSIEAKLGVTTGISAQDRSTTILTAVNPAATPRDLVVPGHIFPIRARLGGVLERAGHTEGGVDLARISGSQGAAVICEIMNDDGSMMRGADLVKFAAHHEIPFLTIPDLISYRLMQETLVEEVMRKEITHGSGTVQVILFRSRIDHSEHLALLKNANGVALGQKIVDVRVLNQRPLLDAFGDTFGQGSRISQSLKILESSQTAVVLYITRTPTALDLSNEFAELLSIPAKDAPFRSSGKMDPRMIGVGSQILRALGVAKMRVHSSQPAIYKGLSGFGLEVVEMSAIE